MKKLIVFAMLIATVPAYADVTVTVSDKIISKYCEQSQFNVYKPEHNPDAAPFDCKEFVASRLANEVEQGANSVYAQAVQADVEVYKQDLITAEKAK